MAALRLFTTALPRLHGSPLRLSGTPVQDAGKSSQYGWMSLKLSGVFLLLCGMLLHQDSRAQTRGSCGDAYSQAQTEYREGAYQAAVDLLAPCLQSEAIEPSASTEAYRLLALSYLKLDELSSARESVLRLLSENPSYEADPVQDLPAYRALVRLVRDQLGLEAVVEEETTAPVIADDSEVDAEPTAVAVPRKPGLGNLLVSTNLGISSYGGERGVYSESFLGEFGRNAGPLMGLLIEYGLSSTFFVGLGYSLSEYPHIATDKWSGEEYEQLTEGSSKWVHLLNAELRARFRGTERFYPYVGMGVATSYHYMNDSYSTGVGPMFAAGLDFYVDPTMVIFLETEALMIFPGRALDLADHDGSFDPLTSISAGVRFRVAQLAR